MKKPEPNEYNPYFQRYIDLAEEGDFLSNFQRNKINIVRFFQQIPAEKHDFAYAAGKWTIKEILMHIIDAERVFAYRTLVCAREDVNAILPEMDQNLYASNVNVTGRTLKDLLDEFEIVRDASLKLFEHLSEPQSKFSARVGTHPISVRALGYIMIGHPKHHIHMIKERYF